MALADAATMTEDEQNEMIAGMVQRLHDRLIEEPNDTDGWIRYCSRLQCAWPGRKCT